MKVNNVLLIYLSTLIFSFYILRYYKCNSFSAFMLSIFFAQLILNIIYPPTDERLSTDIDSATSLYFFFQIAGIVIFVVYGIIMAINDFETENIDKKFISKIYY